VSLFLEAVLLILESGRSGNCTNAKEKTPKDHESDDLRAVRRLDHLSSSAQRKENDERMSL
jgi:hypothetical protein